MRVEAEAKADGEEEKEKTESLLLLRLHKLFRKAMICRQIISLSRDADGETVWICRALPRGRGGYVSLS